MQVPKEGKTLAHLMTAKNGQHVPLGIGRKTLAVMRGGLEFRMLWASSLPVHGWKQAPWV